MLLHSVRRWISLLAIALVLTIGSASAQPALATVATVEEQAPSRPTTSFEAWFVVEQPPTLPFEAVQLVVDFPVGAKVARHLHGGPGYITMLENEMTTWIGAVPGKSYQSGESFVEPFKVVAEGANLSAAPSSLLVTYLIPSARPSRPWSRLRLEHRPGSFRRGPSHASSRGSASTRLVAGTRWGRCSRPTRRAPGPCPRWLLRRAY